MQIVQFSNLNNNEHQEVYDFILSMRKEPYYYSTAEEMARNYLSATFDYGNNVFLARRDERLSGMIAVISKSVELKREITLTAVTIPAAEEGVLEALLARIYQHIELLPYEVLKIGFAAGMEYMFQHVERAGFSQIYRNIRMKLTDSTKLDGIVLPENLLFQEMNHENMLDYSSVTNPAFLSSPNGGAITVAEMEELLEEYKERSHFFQIGYYEGRPAIGLTIDITATGGWIDTLGVHPDYQGQGLSKYGLKRGVDLLRTDGCTTIQLGVFDSNTTACTLYRKYGFVEDKVNSTWFVKYRKR